MTQNIDICLRNLDNIDMQTLYAESSVLEAYMSFDDKINEMMICEAKGTTKQKTIKKPLVVKFMDFIRKCVDKIIKVASDLLVKMKTMNAYAIAVPYNVEDILADIDNMVDIDERLEKYFEDGANHKVTDKDITFLKSLTEKAVFNVDKVTDSKDKHLMKRDAWLKLRDKIYNVLQSNKRLKKTFDNWANIYAGEDSIDADCFRELSKLYTRMTNASVKIMTSFTFSGMGEKITKSEAKKKNIENAPKKEVP